MKVEIERKFLVMGDAWRHGEGTRYVQAYLRRDAALTIRARIAGDQAFLTIKGASRGPERLEFEYPIPRADAEQLMRLCDKPPVEKIRREVLHGGFCWEVDEFLGANQGLVLAELELESADQPFPRPAWLGAEVTGDARYYNACLAAQPYRTWAGTTS